MSAPVREPDDNESLNDGALHYAPKRARQVERDHDPESAAPRVNTASWPHTLEPPEPPWKGRKRRGAFVGDVAVAELRTKLALAPDRIPEPLPDSAARVFGGLGRRRVVGGGGRRVPRRGPAARRAPAPQSNEKDWRPPAPPQTLPRQSEVNAAGIAVMMKNGADRMENGDIAGARLMFQRAAQTGDAGAAFALAETYDPLVLRELGRRITIMSDIALAQSWYKKARDLGATFAPERIASL